MFKKNTTSTRIPVTLGQALYKKLEILATQQACSMSTVMKSLIERGLESEQQRGEMDLSQAAILKKTIRLKVLFEHFLSERITEKAELKIQQDCAHEFEQAMTDE